jgi:hypothetical protein
VELPDEILTSLGRVTIGAANLEVALGTIAGERLGLNAMDVLGKPGEAVRTARKAVEAMPDEDRMLFSPHIDVAAELLARRHLFIHALWVDTKEDGLSRYLAIHMRSFVQTPVTASILDEFAQELHDTYGKLIQLLTDQINGRLSSPKRC